MKNKIINIFYRSRYYNVIHIHREKNKIFFSSVVFYSKKNKLILLNSSISESIEQVVQTIRKSAPLVLIFTGKGIISKRNVNSQDLSELINFKESDFYSYKSEKDDLIFSSVTRKDFIDNIVTDFKTYGHYVINVVIGPFVIEVLGIFLKGNTTINTGRYIFTFENNCLVDFDINRNNNNHSGYTINIDNEIIQPKNILHYAGIINFLFSNKKSENISESIQKNREEYIFKNIFDRTGIFLLIFFLISLFMSYIILDYFNTKNIEIQKHLITMNNSYDKILNLEKNIKNKEFILSKSGVFKRNFHSFYIDKMMSILPSDLKIEALSLNAITDDIKQGTPITFEENTIAVLGQTINNFSFNRWLNELRKMTWTNEVIIKSYKKNKIKGDFFEIIIRIKTDV